MRSRGAMLVPAPTGSLFCPSSKDVIARWNWGSRGSLAHVDPNETLRKIRELATDIERGKDEFEIAETAQEFRQWFEALDEYLKQGGFLPKDWRRKPWDKDQED